MTSNPEAQNPDGVEFKSSATADLDHATYDSLKRELLSIRNAVLPEEPVIDFDADKNVMAEGIAGAMDGNAVRYPRGADKQVLLAHALDQAQRTARPEHKALILTSAATNIHLYEEANGRAARRLYRRLTGADESVPEAPRDDTMNSPEREHIDLGTAFTEDPRLSRLADTYAYYKREFKSPRIRVNAHRPGVTDYKEAVRIDPEDLTGLSAEEGEDLVSAVGADEYGNTYAQDHDALDFAGTAALNARPELQELIYRVPNGKFDQVGLHNLLGQLTPDERRQFVAELWEYRKLRAQATIDFFTDEVGNMTIKGEAGQATTLRDFAIARTNNFISRPPGANPAKA